jgi:hypothetical protein
MALDFDRERGGDGDVDNWLRFAVILLGKFWQL